MNRWLAALLLCIPTLTSLLPIPPQHYLPLSSALYNKDVASITSADMTADSSELLDLSAWAKQRTLSEEAINSEHLVFGVQQGEKLTFSPSQIENRLECSQGTLLGITVTSLPSQSSGQLLLDGQPLANWSYLSREQIENLTFEPSPNATEANFSFLPFLSNNEYENAMSASLRFSAEKNTPPVVEGDSYRTKINMKLSGWFPVTDADGDDMEVLITRKPFKGTITSDGLSFRYEPYLNASGTDQFFYCVLDSRGALSEEAAITVELEQSHSSSFADMAGHSQEYAAVMLQEYGILSGEQVGGQTFFYPDRTVTRGDFLVMLMACIGLDQNLPVCVNTGLSNDVQIPLWLKPYVHAALDLGILEEKPFEAQEEITRAEAVVLVSRATGKQVGSGKLCYTDAEEIPVWAVGSYRSLSGQKILDAVPTQALPNQYADRAYCADLLWSLIEKK